METDCTGSIMVAGRCKRWRTVNENNADKSRETENP